MLRRLNQRSSLTEILDERAFGIFMNEVLWLVRLLFSFTWDSS